MKKLILIGASTGGPGQIKKLIQDLDLKDCTLIIAQHMQADFLPSYAASLDKECHTKVSLLNQAQFLDDGIYVCAGNIELFSNLRASINEGSFAFCPNVDLLFSSAAKIIKDYKTLAILLTGIGDDGARGLYELYKNGAYCIGESEASCVVYGMPKRAYELNKNLKQLDIEDIKIELDLFIKA